MGIKYFKPRKPLNSDMKNKILKVSLDEDPIQLKKMTFTYVIKNCK